MNKTRGWALGVVYSLFLWAFIILLFTSCGGNKSSNKETFNIYQHCSQQSYDKNCSNTVVKRLLQPYELWDYYCHQDYLQCLRRR